MEDRLLNVREAAKLLNVSVSFAYSLLRRGDIPSIRIGAAVRVRREDLDRYIAENRLKQRGSFNAPPKG